ncbi:xanthine dehydrogenase accessory protein XdhC [Buttiauxella sp. A111]|uniref:xanthine dehydrogenase accessory protein XdhC n=1 Tax=Buttiauxella sp. A111 TaxID=2563088 RepID=UPI0010E24E9A|nr:xanthine dehydrogenase accessory protein XdhC [Buttiauxella sp. A111]GDX04084.1 xanthine dehydrogenase accessory protein XdhC [Buttiauxella sp. A111]
MNDDEWISILMQLRERREPCVLLTVLADKGSVPRNCGTKMIVGREHTYLTIGGGHLEYQCIAMARAMLDKHITQPHTEHFNLGARLGQCCGGMTSVLFEPLIQAQPQMTVFGAGHVGQALVALLSTLPCHITWVDERPDLFACAPKGVKTFQAEEPLDAVHAAPAQSYFIVMTHSHPRDLELTEAILKRGDYRYLGLIGSQTKRQRFEYRLAGKGITPDQLSTLRCPVGLPDVKGKLPAEIAVAIAAEIIAVYQAAKVNGG